MGPFYCPTDQKIYIDPTFFNELSQRFGAPGDFAMAYVIAHEVGHHIQNLEGTLDQRTDAQARVGRPRAMRSRSRSSSRPIAMPACGPPSARRQGSILEAGDLEEGMRAAEAIGDDTLQKQMQGTVVPESFTHGSVGAAHGGAPARHADRQPGSVQILGLSLTSILPVFAPLNRPRKASGMRSSPSTTVSRDLTWPLAIQPPMSR